MGSRCQARVCGSGCRCERQEQQFQLDFRAVFGASNDTCDRADIFVDNGRQQIRDVARDSVRSTESLKASPFISRANSAQTRVPASRNRMSSTKSAVSMKVSPRIWRISAGSISERTGAGRRPRCCSSTQTARAWRRVSLQHLFRRETTLCRACPRSGQPRRFF